MLQLQGTSCLFEVMKTPFSSHQYFIFSSANFIFPPSVCIALQTDYFDVRAVQAEWVRGSIIASGGHLQVHMYSCKQCSPLLYSEERSKKVFSYWVVYLPFLHRQCLNQSFTWAWKTWTKRNTLHYEEIGDLCVNLTVQFSIWRSEGYKCGCRWGISNVCEILPSWAPWPWRSSHYDYLKRRKIFTNYMESHRRRLGSSRIGLMILSGIIIIIIIIIISVYDY